MREIVEGVGSATNLQIGVRISIFDFSPYKPGEERIGCPEAAANYPYAFGGTEDGKIDLEEPMKLMELFEELGIELVCTTAGSPYYSPHIQRPASFPPSDGYLPPEDPLVGVERQIEATAELKKAFPNLIFVGSVILTCKIGCRTPRSMWSVAAKWIQWDLAGWCCLILNCRVTCYTMAR